MKGADGSLREIRETNLEFDGGKIKSRGADGSLGEIREI